MKPIIGVTPNFINDPYEGVAVPYTYLRSIEAAGGVPLVLPVIRDESLADRLVGVLHGLLLSGGVDVDPSEFGEDPHPKLGPVSPERDLVELAVARRALEHDMPVLAICRGIQLLNVAAGGTIVQDIEAQLEAPIKHRQQAPRWHASHRVTVQSGSKLETLVKEGVNGGELWVNTFHHQSVKKPAPLFVVSATAPDGVIEAIESTGHSFVVGVQWPPEGMWEHHPHFLGLFEGLVGAARERANNE